jgi:RNA methyltransferase, TrmH family
VPISSPHNALLREIRKAVRSGRPTPDGLVVAEGPHLLQEALHSAWRVERVLHTPEAERRFPDLLDAADGLTIALPSRAFSPIATTETTQGIVALVRPFRWRWQDVIGSGRPLVVVLDTIQDPGNVGTILRSAEAFGATGILLTEGCAKSSNGKVLRAAAGSLFRLHFLEGLSHHEIVQHLVASRVKVYALDGSGHTLLTETSFRDPCALVTGNEGSGISPELLRVCEGIRIATEHVESLNAAIACSIALFEAARQRNAR